MYYEKRYLQFNNLVFDGYDMLSDYDESVSFKGSSTAYSYGHGSYMPLKAEYLFVDERNVSMTITLKVKKVPCEYREYYVRFAEQELYRSGRLWAIKNNEILWAWAVPKNIRPINSMKKNVVEWNVEFVIPGGVWHKADKLKTFVLPYDVCLFMECKGYKTLNPCKTALSGDCCIDCIDKKIEKSYEERCFCCCVDEICPDMALCYHMDEQTMQGFYSCDVPYQLVYDCQKAEQYSDEDYLGQKICTKDSCSNIIAGRFYSETDIPTENVSLVIRGQMKNPIITINGNTNIIKGEYEILRIDADGSVYELTECCENLLDPSVWIVPSGENYGWTIYPQENSIEVNLNMCCSVACLFIQHDAITT